MSRKKMNVGILAVVPFLAREQIRGGDEFVTPSQIIDRLMAMVEVGIYDGDRHSLSSVVNMGLKPLIESGEWKKAGVGQYVPVNDPLLAPDASGVGLRGGETDEASA